MVRDQITFELWEELNRLYLFVTSPEAAKCGAAVPAISSSRSRRAPPDDRDHLCHAPAQPGLAFHPDREVPGAGG